jgi:ABC-type microcin C transport system duplicated ATPase subunit YejF
VGYPGKIVSGEILFEGRDILKLSDKEITALRGDRISMIFQQPTSCLNPVFDTGFQLGEVAEIHQQVTKRKESRARAVDMLRMVGIPDPERRVTSFPHELWRNGNAGDRYGTSLLSGPLIADDDYRPGERSRRRY